MSVYAVTRIYASTSDASSGSAAETVYATAREFVGTTQTINTTRAVGQQFTSPSYRVGQYFPIFDTSAVPAGAASAVFSFNVLASVSTDTWEIRAASSAANAIAGSALAALTPLFGSMAVPTIAGRKNTTFSDVSGMARSSSCTMVMHSQRQRLNTAPTVNDQCTVTLADQTGTTDDPYLDVTMQPWSFVGVSAVVTATATPLTLTEPAGVADGDLLVACIASRSTATTAVTNTGWTAVGSQNNNNALTTTSALASGTMLYRVKSGTTDLTFDIPAGVSVAMGQIVAYRGSATTTPLDVSTAVTTAVNTLAVSVTGLTTTQDDDLIVAMAAGGQEAAWSAFSNVTTPLTASGATDTTTAPSTTAWIERADNLTTTGNDTSLAIFDAVRTTTGATGNLTATASLGAGHVVIAGAFKIAAAAAGVSASVTGQAVTASVGTVTATGKASATATGQAVTASVGAVTISTAAALAGVGVWNGTSWVQRPAKVWTGSAWVQKPVKTWNGSAWV